MLAPHHPGAEKIETMEGIRVSRFAYFFPETTEVLADGKGIQNNIRASFLGKLQALPLITAEYFAARSIISENRFPVVNSHWLIPSGLVIATLKNRFGFRHVITIHAADYYLLKRIPAGPTILRWILSRADAVLPVSSAIEAGIREHLPRGTLLKVIPMAADLQLFKPADPQARKEARDKLGLESELVLLFVGKLSEKKGVQYLIQAAEKASRQITDLKVIIVGEGHLKESLERMTRASGKPGVFQFKGPVPHEQLSMFYSASDALVVPSIIDRHGESEGMPVVILEALASGLPVIGTTCCAVPQELKQAGFIEIEPARPEQLEKAILNINSNAEKMVDTSIISQFSWTETSRKYAETFRETMSKP